MASLVGISSTALLGLSLVQPHASSLHGPLSTLLTMQAKSALANLRAAVDALIVIPNDKLLTGEGVTRVRMGDRIGFHRVWAISSRLLHRWLGHY